MIWVLLLLAACSDDKEAMLSDADKTAVYVSVSLSTSMPTPEATRTASSATRTTPTPSTDTPSLDMEAGMTYDNYIHSQDIELFLFDSDKKFVEKVKLIITGTTSVVGTLEGITDDDIKGGKLFHLVALCNHKGALKATDLNENELTDKTLDQFIEKLTYTGYTDDFTQKLVAGNTENTRIPMWGITSVTFAPRGEMTNAGTINLLRALAKVRIKLSDNLTDYTLDGVTLNVANDGGYVAAQKNGETVQAYCDGTTSGYLTTAWNYIEDNNGKYVSNEDFSGDGYVDDYQTLITFPSPYCTEEDPLSNLSFSANVKEKDENDEEATYHVIYIPEYKNIGDDATPAYMSLNISKGETETKTYDLHFADYSNGASPTTPEWDIIRNDIYEYTITNITETGGLQANVRVMPWNYEVMGYELSQNAAVKLTSDAGAVYNTSISRYTNETVYSAEGDVSNYATFTIKVDEPVGVRWVAHLTDPYNFAFTDDSQTYGYGGVNEVCTLTVKPRSPYGNKILPTELYFTMETLLDTIADITPVDASGNYVTGDYGIAKRRIHISQVQSKSATTTESVPFTVNMSAWGTAVHSGETKIAGSNKTGYYTWSGLTYPTEIETTQIYKAASGAMCNNGVVMAAYNNTLYCMWQTSASTEDTPDTHIHYSTSSDGGTTWSTPADLTTPYSYTTGYTSSGGWLMADDRLIAYVNTWEASGTTTSLTAWTDDIKKLNYGYTRYIDMSNPSTITNVTMADGNQLNAIFEQDPHVVVLPDGTKRIINGAHFQTATIQGTEYTNGLYVNPIYADYTTDGITGWAKAELPLTEVNGTQSRQMEPSMFKKANGDLVMIFRDNLKLQEGADGTRYTHRTYASISHDYGLTWSTPVATNLYDSKSKQCAGNLPDGTAFIVNNPVQSEIRSPLVLHLSADGQTFDKAYLLRTGYTTTEDATGGIQDRQGEAGTGYCYPKALVHGDYLYVSYSTNKEDVEYTRIPLSSIQLNDLDAR